MSGLLLLALGLVLNVKVGLGTSPIMAPAYAVSILLEGDFTDYTFLWYCILILAEVLLHLRRKASLATLVMDLLQLPFSMVFTRLMGVYARMIPDFASAEGLFGTIAGRILLLLLAIFFTGVGAALTLAVKLVPNPGDGIVQTLAEYFGKPLGSMKNIFDIGCVTIAFLLGIAAGEGILGIGVGTLAAMIGVGRCVALTNRFLRKFSSGEEKKQNASRYG